MNNETNEGSSLDQVSNQIASIQVQLNEMILDEEKQTILKPLSKCHDIYLLLIGFT